MRRASWPAGYPAAALLLVVFAWIADTSVAVKSPSFDEMAHLTGGVSYWQTGDFRLHPENGVFPQRWAALPALALQPRLPELAGPASRAWVEASVWQLGYPFFYGLGNDLERMLRAGRRMILGLSVGLGLLVYAWSRRLFGPAGGMLSLCLYAFSPNVLAHSRLITSDLAVTFGFSATLACLWALLHRLSVLRVAGFGCALAVLLSSKASSLLILPIGAILVAVRLTRPEPLLVQATARARAVRVHGAGRIATALVLACTCSAALALAWIWVAYGGRFPLFRLPPLPSDPESIWAGTLDRAGWIGGWIEAARALRLVPEPYLYGLAYTVGRAASRSAFLLGAHSEAGWWTFFPVALMLKTPPASLALVAIALVAVVQRARAAGSSAARWWRRSLYRAAPLLALLAVYWPVALGSSLNIGLRHLLPTYPAIFILTGAAIHGFGTNKRLRHALLLGLVALLALETALTHPHYLAYFSPLVGGPAHGYRYLVDSSLDWGQDLPALARWLEEERAGGRSDPVYLSYFGTGSPAHYGIEATPLPSFFDTRAPDRIRATEPLTAGTYCVSATMLQGVYRGREGRGAWSREKEQAWRVSREQRNESAAAFDRFERLRFARLITYLRQREPDAAPGFSILVYRLGATEVKAALEAPLDRSASPREIPADGGNG